DPSTAIRRAAQSAQRAGQKRVAHPPLLPGADRQPPSARPQTRDTSCPRPRPCERSSLNVDVTICSARMVSFSRADVEAIAALAQLELDDAEIDLFGRQLAEILTYVEQLQRIDTAGVAPTASVVSAHAADRDDVVRPSLDRAEAMANAPDAARQVGLFRVPR